MGLLPAIWGLPATKPRKGLLPGVIDFDSEEKLICCYTVEAGSQGEDVEAGAPMLWPPDAKN